VVGEDHQDARNGVDKGRQDARPGDGDHPGGRPAPLFPPRVVARAQQTRLHLSLARSGQRLQEWAQNPWRRVSLLLIVLLSAFVCGNAVTTITGALDLLDPVGALVCVVLVELAIRLRRPLLVEGGDPLILQLLDMARIGLLYGLLMEGFKLL
jgi:hypothetical protein